MRKAITIAIAVLIGIMGVNAQEQNPDAAIRLRLAQSHERAGDWERAVPIYESLLESDPRNHIYYDALRRGYIQLKQYDKAVTLIERRLALEEESPLLLASLGGVYYQMGQDDKADSIWQKVLKTNPANPSLYRLVASQMMEHRLYDRAIGVFQKARENTGDSRLFIDELANLYSAFQQYGKAAGEYVHLLRLQPQQLAAIQSRLSLFLHRPEAREPVRTVLEEEVNQRSDSVPLRRLYAWVLMEDGNYRDALDQHLFIDRISKSRGVELFNFGQRALVEGEYGTAAQAFQEVLSLGPSPELVPVTRLGYAKAVENLSSAAADTIQVNPPHHPWPVSEAQASFGKAVRLYESVINDYPRSPYAAEAYYRIGLIKEERFNDLDGALSALREVPGIAGHAPLTWESRMKAAEVLVAKNDLSRAREQYRSLLLTREAVLRDRVLFSLAELDYFTAQFDTAASVLRQLSSNTVTDLANDALKLLYFIEANMASRETLKAYAGAHLFLRQCKYPEALEAFRAVVRQYPRASLMDEAVLKIAEIQVLIGKPQDALATLSDMIMEKSPGILQDRAMMRSGEIYERILKNPEKAIQFYEQLLTAYPGSIYAEEARRRIRLLRGDAL